MGSRRQGERRNVSRGRFAWIVLVLLSLPVSALPATADPAGLPPVVEELFAVSLDGPEEFVPDEPQTFAGVVTFAATPAPLQPVEILVDGARAALVLSGVDGSYTSELTFTDVERHSVEAVVYGGLPLEARSEPREVRPVAFRLTVTLDGSGHGRVTSTPPGIDCGAACTASFTIGTAVTLAPEAAVGSVFAGWSGDCTGDACSLEMSADRTVTARFDDVEPPAAPSLTGTVPPSPANANAPRIVGAAETGSVVALYATADCSGTAAAAGPAADLASPGLQVTVQDDTLTTFRATATDAAGNTSGCSAPLTYVEDSSAPSAPLLTATVPASPANANAPRIAGSAEGGTTVRLHTTAGCSGTPAATGTASALASPGIAVSVADDTSTTFRATATDAAGNRSACSGPITFVEDSTAPPAPFLSSTVPASPANANAPRVAGSAEDGAAVKLYATANCTGTPAATGTAAALASPGIAIAVADDSSVTVRATATDGAGNTSACSAPITYVEDSTAPSAPSGLGTSPGSPANANTPQLTGAAEPGALVRVFAGTACTGAPAGEGTAGTDGRFAVGVTVPDNSTTSLRASARDAAGNVSGCSSARTYVEDSLPPDAPALSSTSPASPANQNAPRVLGSTESGSTVRLFTNADCSGSPVANGTAAAFASPGLAVTVADDTTTAFRGTATDAAGNTSACSPPITFVEDSTASAPPSLSATDPASPANDNSPLVIGAAEAGSTVRLFTTADCSGAPAATGPASTLAAPGLPVSVPDDSTTSFRANATDAAGNRSACSAAIAYVEDSQIPPAPVLTGTTPPSPANQNAPRVLGSAEAGSTVRLFINAGCSGAPVATGTAAELASPGIQVAVPDDTTTTFRANAVSSSGNTSGCSSGLTYVEDSTAPSPPVLTGTSPASPANDNDPEVLGTAEAGATVRLFTTSDCSGTPLATGTPDGITVHVDDDTTTSLRATATDAAGNESACSAEVVYVEDSLPPAAPALTSTVPASPANDNTPALRGTAEAGSTVRVFASACTGTPAATGTAASFASPGLDVVVADNTTTSLRANATDAAGNVSGCSSALVYVEDSAPPSAGTVNDGGGADIDLQNSGATMSANWSGFSDPSGPTRFDYSLGKSASCPGDVVAPVNVGIATSRSTSGLALTNGTTYFNCVRALDAAGNAGAFVPSDGVTVDLTAPAAPILSGTSPASPANDNAPEVIGTAEAGSTVSVFTTADCSGPALVTGSASALASPGLTAAVPDDTTVVFRARARDGAGNVSQCSAGISYVEDSIAPGDATLTGTSPPSPANDNDPELIGTADAGTTVLVYNDPTNSHTCPEPPVASGPASLLASPGITVNVADNSFNLFRVRVRDAAGNTSACRGFIAIPYTEDSIAPNPPTVSGTIPSSPANNNAPKVFGSVFSGTSTVEVFTTSDCSGPPAASGLASTYTGGNLAVSVADNSTTTFRARAKDTAGNASACSFPSQTYVEDSLAPTFAGIASATAISTTSVSVAWSAGSDTVSSSLTYDVCRSTTVGGCLSSFTVLESTTATSRTYSGLDKETRYFFVVRARDQAGNRELNTVERSALTWGQNVIVQVEAGSTHSCALIADGTVRCWGDVAHSGGTGLAALNGVVSLSARSNHSCALLVDGTARCWGENGSSQLGDGTSTDRQSPVQVSGLTGAVQISGGLGHTCALLAGGGVRCWGDNTNGELGTGDTAPRSTPAAVSGLTDAISVSAGESHTCALRAAGEVRCWGGNDRGQLGTGGTAPSTTPVAVSGLGTARAVSAGANHACAITSGGGVRCWGDAKDGKLGNGVDGTFSTTPVTASGLSNVKEIAAAAIISTYGSSADLTGNTCALTATGTVFCWGDNHDGKLGVGDTTDRLTPTQVAGLAGATDVAAGGTHACARRGDGTARCWGGNGQGELGDGSFTQRTTPVAVVGVTGGFGMTRVSAGAAHTCAVRSDGTARCWGGNISGRLGDGTTTDGHTPVAVSGLSDVIDISAGGAHTCAVVASGGVRCWGANGSGQLGNSSTSTSFTPVAVTGLSNAVAVSAGNSHTCAVLADGGSRCWGEGGDGRLGNGSTTDRTSPVSQGLSSVTAISAGLAHTCALTAASGRCWGRNASGQLGTGDTSVRTTPAVVSGLGASTSVTAGSSTHSCATEVSSKARCWGINSSGQLGTGDQTQRTTATIVSGLTGATSISAGSDHTCALVSSGAARCWGGNGFGQVGDGTTTMRTSPVAVRGPTDVTQVEAGGIHTCAARSPGVVMCWGFGGNGRLGDGGTTTRTTPVEVTQLP